MELVAMLLWVFLWVVFGLIGAAMLSSRNQAGTGCLLGGLLGPLGLLIAAVMMVNQPAQPPAVATPPIDNRPTKQCPECAERVLLEAKKCRFCGHVFDGAA